MTRFVQGLVLVASLALESCAGPPPQPACTLHQPSAEFALPQAPLDFIPVTLGRTTVPFILDTGADASILSTEAGKAMGVRRTTDWALVGQGAGGRTLVYPTRIPVLRLGNGTLPGAMMFVGPLFNMPLSRLPVFGLIGTDIISNWALDLDAEHARLRLYNEEPCAVLAPPWTGPAAPADMFDNGTRYVEVEILLDGKPFDAILDTGSSVSVLGASAAHRLRLDLSHDRAVSGIAAGGLRSSAHEHRIQDVRLGGVQVGPMTFDVLTTGLAGTDLLLGQDFLHSHRIFVSYRQHRLWFAPASTPNQDAVSARR